MDYSKLRKLDEMTLKQMKEGKGPSDECICNLFYTPEGKKGFKSSLKKVFTSLGRIRSKKDYKQEVIPLNSSKGKGGLHSRGTVKLSSRCGKCGCDENIVLRRSVANIHIVSPDVSSVCPCPEDCLPDKEKLNNVTVTVEHCKMASRDSEFEGPMRRCVSEPNMAMKYSFLSVDDDKYDDFEYESSREDSDDEISYDEGRI